MRARQRAFTLTHTFALKLCTPSPLKMRAAKPRQTGVGETDILMVAVGYLSLAVGYLSLAVSGSWISVSGSWISVSGSWISVSGSWISNCYHLEREGEREREREREREVSLFG